MAVERVSQQQFFKPTDKGDEMRTQTIKLYQFSELSDDAKEKAIDNYCGINVDYQWWEFMYDDAKTAGIEITSFDLDRNRHCMGQFVDSASSCAEAIIKNHGDTCSTYQEAKNFEKARNEIVDSAPKDEDGEWEDEYKLDNDLDEIESEFLRTMLEEYAVMLQKEYEHLVSAESIQETIEANEFEFTEDGQRA